MRLRRGVLRQPRPVQALDREVVGLGAAGAEHDLAGSGAEALGDQLAGLLDGASRRAARGVQRRRVAGHRHLLGHRGNCFRDHGRRRRMVEIGRDPGLAHRPSRVDAGTSASSAAWTRGATSVPYSSMLRISGSCGSVPLLYFRSKRSRPRIAGVAAILSATVSRRADVQRALGAGRVLELATRRRRPAALASDAVAHGRVVRPQLLAGLLVGVGDVPGRVHADRQQRLAELLERLAVQVDERREPGRRSADDREHQRHAVAGGADDRLGAAADADPGLQPARLGLGEDLLVGQRRRSVPCQVTGSSSSAAPRTGRASPRTAPRTGRGRSRTAGTTR